MSTDTRKTLIKDYKLLCNDPPHGIFGSPDENNLLYWTVYICGPSDTIWEGGTFRLSMTFSEEYPNKPPEVKFLSKMYHPNVYNDGSICLDILQNNWSSAYTIAAILTSIQSLLPDPNPRSPANAEAARLFTEDVDEYERRVSEIVELSWAHHD